MDVIDEAIRGELRHGPGGRQASEQTLWTEVSQRVASRATRRRARHRLALSLGVVIVVVAAAAAGFTLSRGSSAPQRHHSVVDPVAGPGGFSIDPSSGLINNQTVTVSIHGLSPDAVVWITMCVATPKTPQEGENQCNAPAKAVNLDAHGAATVPFTVDRYLSPGGFHVDCATYAQGCSIALAQANTLGQHNVIANTERVTFANTVPIAPTPLQISIDPSAPLSDGQTVTVSGEGFPASSLVRVGECPSNIDCGGYFQAIHASPEGTFTTPVVVHKTYTVEQGRAGGGESPVTIDCTQALRCFMMAEEASPPYGAASSIPLSFVPNGP